MIAHLRGNLVEKTPPQLILDVQGVGYLLQAPLSTFLVLPHLNESIKLHTHFVVREDAHLLFGFATLPELKLFQALIKVNGIGPSVALRILSGLSVSEFCETVQTQDVRRLQGLPGIGPKTAQRLIIEIQDKLDNINYFPLNKNSDHNQSQTMSDAIAALVELGYKVNDATRSVKKIFEPTLSCEMLIKQALQGLARV